MTEPLPDGISRHGHRFRVEIRVDGNKVRRSFAELADAVVFRDELLADRERQRRARPHHVGKLTVGELTQLWFDGPPGHPELGHRARLTPRAARDYGELIARDVSKVADLDVRELVEDSRPLKVLLTTSLTTHTAKKVHTILNQAFRAAQVGDLGPEHRIPGNPLVGIKLRPARSGVKDIPEVWEIDKLIRAADDEDDRWGLFVRIVATIGARRGEAVALAGEDFDPGRQRLHIRHTVQLASGKPVIGPPKNGSPRTLEIPAPGFWKRLAPYLESSDGGYLFRGFVRDPGLRDEGPKCWHPSYAGHRFLRTVRRLGLRGRDTGRPYGLHNLRHFVATTLYNRPPEQGGRDWVQLAYFLGHRDVSMTMDLYANHVLRPGQQALGRSAAEAWWDES